MSFTLQINADSPEDMRAQLAALALAFGGVDKFVAHVEAAVPTDGGVKITVSPPPAEQPTIEAASAPKPSEQPPAENVVTPNVSAKELRERGIKMLMELFNRNPTVMPQLNALQAKFGVKMFSEIPDDRVPEFYNDALLTVNGTGEVKAA